MIFTGCWFLSQALLRRIAMRLRLNWMLVVMVAVALGVFAVSLLSLEVVQAQVPGAPAEVRAVGPARVPATMPACPVCEKCKQHMGKIASISTALDKAKADVESGDKDAAAQLISKAQKMLAEIQADMKGPCPMCKAVKVTVVNARCPMLGTVLQPDLVPEGLVRVFKGQKVGFCSPACLPAWDKLTDEQKQAKLQAVMPPAEKAEKSVKESKVGPLEKPAEQD